MSDFLEILKYTLPAIVVLVTTVILTKQMYLNESHKRKLQISTKNQELIAPIRMQAYERLVLLLERISPESLIMRSNHSQMTAKQLQADMLNTIRAEFDHNISQQLYVSPQCWEVIKNARSKTIQLINSSATRVQPNGTALDLSRVILEDLVQVEKSPVSHALDFLKSEIKQFF